MQIRKPPQKYDIERLRITDSDKVAGTEIQTHKYTDTDIAIATDADKQRRTHIQKQTNRSDTDTENKRQNDTNTQFTCDRHNRGDSR